MNPPLIWTPKDYGIPPSPPALQRRKREADLRRVLRSEASYAGRIAFPGYNGWLSDLLCMSDLTGNFPALDGMGGKQYGSRIPAVFATAVAHWKMEEATGATRIDATGRGNDQLDTGSVNQSATHKIGSFSAGGNFVKATTFLSCAGTDLEMPSAQPYSFNLWVYLTALQALNVVFGKGSATFNDPVYRIHVGFTGNYQFAFTVRSAGTFQQIFNGLLNANQWTMVSAENDPVNSQIGLAIDGGALTNGALTNGGNASAGAMFIGTPETNAHSSFLSLSGFVDSFTCFNSAITAGNIATLYNSGAGLDY